MLKPGSPAPDFTLPDADMELVKLSKFKGKNLVLYFYPKDDTPGCTAQAIEFSDLEDEFARSNAMVIGINRDDCISHADFRDKHGLAVTLLSDVEGKVCEKYGVWQEKEKDGIRKMCILRSIFVIDPEGILRHVFYGANPKGHAPEILNLIKEMS
jgi:thioredoxin-dependent peroxiredoxin